MARDRSTDTSTEIEEFGSQVCVPRGCEAAESELRLPQTLVELFRLVLSTTEIEEILTCATRLTADALGVPGSHSIVLGDPAAPTFVSSTSADAQRLDGAQVAAGEGPTPTAHSRSELVTTSDLTTDPRWPGLARHLAGTPARTALVVPVVVDGEPLAVISCYGHEDLLRPAVVGTADVLAGALAAVLAECTLRSELARRTEQLEQALASRAVIDQAKGVLVAARGCSVEEAFAELSQLSQNSNRKLRDVAGDVVARASRPLSGPTASGIPVRTSLELIRRDRPGSS